MDAYIKTEANRLYYLKENQNALRVEKYTGLMDHLQNQAATELSRCNGYCKKLWEAGLFITVTCNPKWSEIVENIEEGQSFKFRTDLIARVF